MPSNCGNNAGRRSFDETGFAKIDRFKPFTRQEISSLRRQLPHHCRVGENLTRGRPLDWDFRAKDGLARAHEFQDFFPTRQPQGRQFATTGGVHFITGEIKFVSLGVDDNVDLAMDFLDSRLCRERFDAADSENFSSERKLPALGEGNGGTDAVVGTGAKSDCQTIDVFPVQPRGVQSGFDQTQCAILACAGFLSAPANLTIRHDRDASSSGGELKRQNFHRQCVERFLQAFQCEQSDNALKVLGLEC